MKRPPHAAMRSECVCRQLCLALLLMGMSCAAAAQGCQITLGQPQIDYGKVNKTQLQKQGNRYLLGERHLQMTVQCSRDTDMVLSYLADGINGDVFGFAERGQYSLLLSDARLDGRPVALGAASARSPWQMKGDKVHWLPAMQLAPLEANVPLQGTTFTARLTVDAWLDATSDLSSTAELQASGMMAVDDAAVSLALQANVVPAACKLHLGNDGLVDFGVIATGELSASKTSTLRRSLSAAVTCDSPTRFALRAIDNRQSGTFAHVQGLARSVLFGAGKKASDSLAWSLRFDGAVVGDGLALQPLYSSQGGAGWEPTPRTAFLHTDNRLHGFAASERTAAGPTLIRQLDAMLMVELYVAPMRQLDLRDETLIDGAATLELIYL
ncbi:TPA: DUF1120 domain-containing protein [Pseudomonas putida]|uniref:DUF1120 domain-containing protein n=1 Tax=Pseudomonas putida (strain GB-1) TaxID=76869 RepID=B0KS87_PSEPG|nr:MULTISPECIES: DUF1120 domain-containing protein [Pseudomonas]ABY97042.1 hypothetical protein PputGB1_1134 [Pseudomonas putida GB-1]MBP0706788.1 DUF1120 domain-containing protein [Pseudomonas sp. T34]MCE1000641.1 DUF1120 domain-containing protein [Pseudomonas sp. NMI1173_11]MCK2186225.1 DUF1120 domain-containing protein [Pseudomonas sp. MB04B]MDD2084597.1 DUF1120 domain-containing protein [Pseudomonas putida]